MKIAIELIGRDGVKAEMPEYATAGAAGADLTACIPEKTVIAAGKTLKVPTGIAVAVPDGYAAFIYARSGLATKHGIALANGVGVVDSDYRGEIMVALRNFGDTDYVIDAGERIAQMVIMPVVRAEFKTDKLSETERGDGGFGSTGKL